ncbi:hypothetical protein EYC58_00385 [Candidatus Saccharibacteria bacterium]|nr:MAG: hypothetical protein EYC58_00385 [Candidatus Saccharibacteria bacterium]
MRIRGGEVARNSLFLYALTFSNYFIGLLLFPYISRVLSIEGFGLIGFSMAYVLAFQVLVEFGFMIYATALISKHRKDVQKISEIVSSIMMAKLLLAIVSAVLFIFSVLFVPMLRDNLLIVSLFLLSALLTAMLPDFYFRGIERMKLITVRTVSIRALSLLLVVLFVRDETQIVWIPLAFIVGNTIALAMTFREMHKCQVRYVRVTIQRVLVDIKQSVMFFVSRLAVSVNQSLGAFMLGLNFAPTSIEMGMFSGASRISMASEMMLSPVSDSLYPHMVNKKDYRLFKKVIMFGGIVWFVGCVVVFIFAEFVCRILLGEEYAAAGNLLRILIFGNFMAFFSNMFGYNALVPIGKANHANIALLVSAGINVVACGVLWLTNSISLVSICVVIALTNFVVFGYRGVVFWRNRQLI